MRSASQGPAKRPCQGLGTSLAQARGVVNLITPPPVIDLITPPPVIDLITPPDSQKTKALSPSEHFEPPAANTTAQAQQCLGVAVEEVNEAAEEVNEAEALIGLHEYAKFLKTHLPHMLFLGQPIPYDLNLVRLDGGSYGDVMVYKENPQDEPVHCFKVERRDGGKVGSVKPAELDTLEKIKGCPNIISIVPVELHSGRLTVLAMRKFDMDLSSYIHMHKGLACEKIGKGLIRALEYLSRVAPGFTHGDFKPGNILVNVGPNGEVKEVVVADTGSISPQDKSKRTVCTPCYADPCQQIGSLQEATGTQWDDAPDRLFYVLKGKNIRPDDLFSLMITLLEISLHMRPIVPLPSDLYEWDEDIQYLICVQIIWKMLDPDLNVASKVIANYLQQTIGDDDLQAIGGDLQAIGDGDLQSYVEKELRNVDLRLEREIDTYEGYGNTKKEREKGMALRELREKQPVMLQTYLKKIMTCSDSNFSSGEARSYYYQVAEIILSGILNGASVAETMRRLKQLE